MKRFSLLGRLRVDFLPSARERWRRVLPRLVEDPPLSQLFTIAQRGPEAAPAEAFVTERWQRLLAACT